MNRKITSLVLSGVLVCSMSLSAMAADTPILISPNPNTMEKTIPNSTLYYGKVEKLIKDDSGNISQIILTSEKYGQYAMNISSETLWIDSGNRTKSDPSSLKEGEGLYIFHSPAATFSLPPQSAAFAIVRNIPMDAGSAMYHKIEAISTASDGRKTITTSGGSLNIYIDEKTTLSSYTSQDAPVIGDVKEGGYIMAWYGLVAQSYPGQTSAHHIMLLPQASADLNNLTRGDLVTMLHNNAGQPVVNFAMNYSDVTGDDARAEAIRWASSQKLVAGYDDGRFGSDDFLTLEQFITIIWRSAGSPMLMDYPGLSEYSDAKDISRFAQPALAWAHQKGIISSVNNKTLSPQAMVTQSAANDMIKIAIK